MYVDLSGEADISASHAIPSCPLSFHRCHGASAKQVLDRIAPASGLETVTCFQGLLHSVRDRQGVDLGLWNWLTLCGMCRGSILGLGLGLVVGWMAW